MANGATHRLVAAVATGMVVHHHEAKHDFKTPLPLVSAALAAVLTNIPDWLEPATNPGHRDFFHGVAVAATLGLGAKKLYDWDPQEDWKKVLRYVALIGAGAYLIHLALDATTRRSLPLIGR